jgi:glycosyltransferase involved in cell wall biosynthesis
MENPTPTTHPLVSVIIPCFNHGKYLTRALESVWQQNYPNLEIVVVDDGSTDNTQDVLKENLGVINIYQTNKGLSAARNTGIKQSSGEFLIFLDADDWLLPFAIETNLSFLQWDDKLAFVSGTHEKFYAESNETEEVCQEVSAEHFLHLLYGNYIGMHATVMFRRWVFDSYLYNVKLKACEDYDLYLKIARNFPVFHHTKKIAAYRIHQSNMSGNSDLMLSSVLKVLRQQKRALKTPEEKQAYQTGINTFIEFYGLLLYEELMAGKKTLKLHQLLTML